MSDTTIPATPTLGPILGPTTNLLDGGPARATPTMPRRFTYTQAVRALRARAFSFSGRAGRSEFWWATLAMSTLTVPMAPLVIWLSLADLTAGLLLAVLLSVGLVVMTIAELALTARRLHDRGQSGWLQLIQFVPLGGLALLVICALPGQAGDNRHGPISEPSGARRSPALVVGSFAAWLAAVVLAVAVVGPLSDLTRDAVATDGAAGAADTQEPTTDTQEPTTDLPATDPNPIAAAEQVGGCWSESDTEGQLAPVTCDDPSARYIVTEVVDDSAQCADWYLDADRAGHYLCISEQAAAR